MSLQIVYTNRRTHDRLFLIQKIGSSLGSRHSRYGASVPIYRALFVTNLNKSDPDTNNLVVSAKFLDGTECNPSFIDDFTHDLSLSASAISSSMVRFDGSFTSMGSKVVVFQYMGRGTIYSVMVSKFMTGKLYHMPEGWVSHLLKKFLDSMRYNRIGVRICASQLFLSEIGEVRIGYGATLIRLDKDPSETTVEGWPYISPHNLWEAPSPEQFYNNRDVDRSSCWVWHFGLTALELLYCGIRVRDYIDLHQTIATLCTSGALPQSLSRSDGDACTSNKLPIYHPERASGFRFISNRLSGDFQRLILGCLNPDPSMRTSMVTLLAHPLLTTDNNLNEADLL